MSLSGRFQNFFLYFSETNIIILFCLAENNANGLNYKTKYSFALIMIKFNFLQAVLVY